MSKATIISIAPCSFNEDKASLIPKTYEIPKCDNPDNPVFLVISDAVTFEYIDETRGNRRYPIQAEEIAAAIVRDIRSAIFGKNPDTNAWPGLTSVSGEFTTVSALNSKHPNLLKELKEQQLNWFKHLVTLADDDWTKWRQHKVITSLSISAAKFLGLEREWIVNFEATAFKCPACFSFVPAGALVCKECGTVLNPEKYALLQKVNKG